MIERSILQLRGQKVMLDADLAILYGVATKRLNEQAKRNLNRFPTDFMFQLTPEEKEDVVANCDHIKNLKFSHALPYAHTEPGNFVRCSIVTKGG
ncbi:MAG: ORF6N domain-containing protein [Bacteroidales bacterium]|nr:ORF6N domain-containing protein [Bacteroidales bacterium]